MQVNGIDIIGYSVDGDMATFTVQRNYKDIDELTSADKFTVTDDGQDREVFGGYGILNIKVMSDNVTEVTIIRSLTADMQAVLNSILANQSIASHGIANATETAETASQTASDAVRAANAASILAEANASAIEDLAASVFAE